MEAERSSPMLVTTINHTGITPVEFSLLNIIQFTPDIHSLICLLWKTNISKKVNQSALTAFINDNSDQKSYKHKALST